MLRNEKVVCPRARLGLSKRESVGDKTKLTVSYPLISTTLFLRDYPFLSILRVLARMFNCTLRLVGREGFNNEIANRRLVICIPDGHAR
jgi:hypothetical protein